MTDADVCVCEGETEMAAEGFYLLSREHSWTISAFHY